MLADIFSIVPLTAAEWGLVVAFAAPVILIDELLKLLGRNVINKLPAAARGAAGKRKTD